MGIVTIIIAVAAFALAVYEFFCAATDPTAPYGRGKKIKESRKRAFIVDIVLGIVMLAISIITLLVGFGIIG